MQSSITCLGKSFSSEDERRSYFRKELQKKLPELRKIDGFPIGADEDILNFSDPPYYTACPNPWLNEFISQWETEENELHKLNKGKSNIQVSEPYASDVSEGKNNPVYTAHTYHTKVPHPAIMRYMLFYTQPGDTVLDAFGGTGMTGVAAHLCGNPDVETKYKIEQEWKQLFHTTPSWGKRNAICGDLSPYAAFISYNYNTPSDLELVEKETDEILKSVTNNCSWLYETKHTDGGVGLINYTVWSDIFNCNHCGKEIVFWDAAMDIEQKKVVDEFICPQCNSINDKNTANKAWVTYFDIQLKKSIRIAKSKPVLIVYTYNGKRFQKSADIDDLKLIQKINETPIPEWCPTYELPYGYNTEQPKKSHGVTNVHLFYTKRNLFALSILNKFIENSQIANKLKFILTGMINRSTQMNRVHVNNFFFGGGGWNAGHLKGTLYIPSLPIETSILEQISDKIVSFKRALMFLKIKDYRNLQYVGSATSLTIEDSSIDYVFTDPPFGANIMYSELNFLPESWLKVLTNNNPEAIVNKAQNKSLLDYQELMTKCFKEYYRVLKPGKWMTVEFSNTSAAVWNGIQTALQRAGFVIANVAGLDKKQGGMRSITTAIAVRQDLAISCYKTTDAFNNQFINESNEVNIWSFVEQHLNHLPISMIKEKKSTAIIERSPKILYDRLITFYLMRGLPIPIDAAEFQIKLKQKFKESDGMIFTDEQRAQYEDEKQKQGITQQLSLVFDIIYSESDAVEWMKVRLAKNPQKYSEIQPDFRKANTATRKGEKEFELETLLNENFIPMNDGRWRTPDMNEAKDREHFRTATLLKEFGRYLEELSNSKGKLLKDVRVEALREGFKSLWQKSDFDTIVNVAEKIPPNLLIEDEQLLMFYDIAKDRV